mgnify:CR=1 FL=1
MELMGYWRQRASMILIVLFVFIGTAIGACSLPVELNWKNIIGIGFLAGIGFTMSIFILFLAFENETIINNAKFIILLGSLVAGLIGFISLKLTLSKEVIEEEN